MTYGQIALPATLDDIQFVAIGLELIDTFGERYPHSAIIYRDQNQLLSLLEFHFNGQIASNQSQQRFSEFAWAVPNLKVDALENIAEFCELIRLSAPKLRYGFRFLEDSLLAQNGATVCLQGTSVGLTCATFVLAIFKRLGINLLQLDTWQFRDEDEKWQQRYFKVLKKNPSAYNHTAQSIAQVQQELISPCARYKPQEVFASGMTEKCKLDFDTAQLLGIRIWEGLNRLYTHRATLSIPSSGP